MERLLVAVDTSSASLRAVEYVAEFLRGDGGRYVELVHVSRRPDRDLFPDDAAWEARLAEQEAEAEHFLALARDILVERGMRDERVVPRSLCIREATVSETILDLVREGGFGTLVVGKRGVSKTEEFLYGSVSSAVVHGVADCCVWVVG